MIRFCCYCQSFIGQLQPYDDFNVSHGICEKCASIDLDLVGEDLPLDVKVFYDALFSKVMQGEAVSPEEIVRQSTLLNLKQKDVFLGILHPLLWQIGKAYESGRLSVEQEHLFTHAVENYLSFLPEPESDTGSADILVFPAASNHHTIGAEFFKRLIEDNAGLTVKALTEPPLTQEQLKRQLDETNARIVGVSIALPDQIIYVKELAKWLTPMHDIRLVIGGPAIPAFEGEDLKELAIDHVSDPFNTLATIETIESFLGQPRFLEVMGSE